MDDKAFRNVRAMKARTPDEEATDRLIVELREKYPQNLHQLAPAEHGVYAVRPSRQAWARFRQSVKDGAEFVGMENLLIDCVVHPTGDDLDALLDRFPALVETFTNQLASLAGLDAQARAKKL